MKDISERAELIEGKVIRAVGGFFYIRKVDGEVLEAKARGKMRRIIGEIIVGDMVICDFEEEQLIVTAIKPRRNYLLRPPLANVDKVVLVFALAKPEPDWLLLDRLLVFAEQQKIEPIIFLSKADLVEFDSLKEIREKYEHTKYPLIIGSEEDPCCIATLQLQLDQGVVVLAGPSGVGKSSLMNRIFPDLNLLTGTVSERRDRGRHTTRHVQLYPLASGALIADTPGFSSFENESIAPRDLADYFPEMRQVLGQCRFTSCMHLSEPNCAVKDLLNEGKISLKRYNSYVLLLQEMKLREQNRY